MHKDCGLYKGVFEHDACGIGAIANINGEKTHKTIEDALNILINLEHRGGSDENSGDGAGILLQIPHRFFKEEAQNLGFILPKEGEYAVGMFFFSNDEVERNETIRLFENVATEEGLKILAWREVPYDTNGLGVEALKTMPYFKQVIIEKPKNIFSGIDFERRLYVLRRSFEKRVKDEKTYVVSLSSKTIVYKGMLLAGQLKNFYKDLTNQKIESAIAMVHSRYSTNTVPNWERAHPNRYIIHNGEINTLRGNVNKLYSREETITSRVLGDEIKKVLPIINKESSDSAILDNTLEFLTMNGRDMARAVMMLIPEPWVKNTRVTEKKKAFYEYNGTLMEPWDGPAAIVFSDGDKMGAVLDRNGLRPARYYITKNDTLILSSEVGALDIKNEDIRYKGRLTPGKMLLVDTKKGKLIEDKELKERYYMQHPYDEWLSEGLVTLDSLYESRVEEIERERRGKLFKAFGYSYEDLTGTILPMMESGEEPLGSMGIDTPLAVLSKREQPLFNYFKQLFAQVTNPPIDAIREEVVTSTNVYLGTGGNILEDKKDNCNLIKLNDPILSDEDLAKIKAMYDDNFKAKVLEIVYEKTSSDKDLEKALDNLFENAYSSYKEGYNLFILSDKKVNETQIPIPSLLAVSGLHRFFINKGIRTAVDIIVESGEPREVHHFATLLGFGASAINPYLLYESVQECKEIGLTNIEYKKAVKNINKALVKGIIKICSKMGISTIQSYQGAQIFEALGIKEDVINKYFTKTVSRIGGIGLEEIHKETLIKHKKAFDKYYNNFDFSLESNGMYKERSGKEEHLYNPLTIHKLQESTKKNDYNLFKEYSALLNKENNEVTLRSLLDFNFEENPIPIDEVESIESIVKRFKTGAMSYGSISKEAHEALAIAMNRIGGKSNTGEGGEDSSRYILDKNGDSRRSAIKQIASGRFGVTTEYLVNADEIQIKMAQGAKPGEGGHLPSKKVYPWIAKTRGSTPAVELISPPPHHDIYSIEDLAQLIYDLKNANRKARISVKLVAESGVGTIASGVAKGGADVILISGYDGGTGAAPRTSIQHAGIPWELGVAEANQTLLLNGLRDRVTIEVDGKLMTGRDVAIAALLGAEEFGFATAPLVTLGCVMMRVCNLDTCPVGIATQNEELRKRFKGKPEYVVNFMYFIAQELREYMAKLGFRNVEDMIGRVDKLRQRDDIKGFKGSKVDLSSVLYVDERFKGKSVVRDKNRKSYNLDKVIDTTLLLPMVSEAIEKKENLVLNIDIRNIHRTLGTILGSELTRRYGKDAMQDETVRIKCNGSAGQSFGAFVPKGITLEVIGDANDYFGKGLSGGKLIVSKPKECTLEGEDNIIIGNVALYGATSGKAFINGVAGERFAVRNSGAIAVVEGVGDHGLEYMTGGTVVILGEMGINFAAGMSGGVAYVYDSKLILENRVNKDMVSIEGLNYDEVMEVRNLIREHYKETNSKIAKNILDNFDFESGYFKKVMPKDYAKIIKLINEKVKSGLSKADAALEAFYERSGV